MFTFSVRDMRVSSQARALRKAVNSVDAEASVVIDMSTHEVQIVPSTAGATELSDAISHAGFDPVLQDSMRSSRGPSGTPPKIPFEGCDHDFTAAVGTGKHASPGAIAGASRLNGVLPAEALGPLSEQSRGPTDWPLS